jgi:17beta-estradiol 17-dehydrogenase / very-long-chain 3-oxoacyl-CoA reductase
MADFWRSVTIPRPLTLTLEVVGALTLLIQARRLCGLLGFIYGAPFDLKARYKKAGSWAVVTGGSDGIGRALALELATRGFNVCIISYAKEQLTKVEQEIRAKNVQARAIFFDFSVDTDEAYDKLTAQMEDLDIAIFVNNVGTTYKTGVAPFETVPIQEDSRVMRVNCIPTLRLTKFILPKLKAKKCGAIINISSLSAVVRHVPYLSVYAGTKAFVRAFTESIMHEVHDDGVDVLVVTPGFVSTAMTQGQQGERPPLSFQMVDPTEMARDTLNALGRSYTTCGHRNHNIYNALLSWIPEYSKGRKMKHDLYEGYQKQNEAARLAAAKLN